MTIATIRAALESRLSGMGGALPSAMENVDYSPTVGVAWQRVRMLVNTPVDHAVTSDVIEHRGFLEVILHYPQGVGTATAAAKAQAIAARFAPVQTLSSGSTRVEITKTAHIGTGFPLDGWFCIPVSIPWVSFTG